jgi:hypothetical protein
LAATGTVALQYLQPALTGEPAMNYILIRHKVTNFEKWKDAYDAHFLARATAGLKEEHLLHNVDDHNEVVVLFSTQDLNLAKEFAASSDLRAAMQKSGVIGKPDVYFLNE